MIIAKDRKANNIAEYLIYMYQIEDMIRATGFNMAAINEKVVDQYQVSEKEKKEIKSWYEGLIDLMKEEKIEKEGHLLFLKNTINDLNDFHLMVLKASSDNKYIQLYQTALPNIQEFRKRSKSEDANDIEICINGMYGLLLLRLQKRKISKETLASFQTFSEFLGYFSLLYKKYENGSIEL